MSMTWCLPVKTVRELAKLTRSFSMSLYATHQRLRPNPSLKLTRYGRHCKPGLSHSHYCLSPGLQYLPTRAA
jgi:hypothetical protein